MSKGPRLTEDEIARARQLYGYGLTWREVGERIGRDHSGLCRQCKASRSQSKAQTMGWVRRYAIDRRWQAAE
jgi:hypothetical protein